MRRSGQHAVLFWLANHFSKEILLLNNASYRSDKEDVFQFNSESPTRDAYFFNVEDADLRTVMGDIKYNIWATNMGPSEKVRHILILRDPYNLFASRIVCGYGYPHHCLPFWLEHAREFVGQTSLLPQDTIKISFNEWVRSQSYRRSIADRLELDYTERHMYDVVERYESRFQMGVRDARQLDLFERWRACDTWPSYRGQVENEELHALAEKIFGEEARDIREKLGLK